MMSTITAEQARKATRSVVYQRLRDEAGQVKRAYPKALEHAFKLIYEYSSEGNTYFSIVRLYGGISLNDGSSTKLVYKVRDRVIRKLFSLGYKISKTSKDTFISWE